MYRARYLCSQSALSNRDKIPSHTFDMFGQSATNLLDLIATWNENEAITSTRKANLHNFYVSVSVEKPKPKQQKKKKKKRKQNVRIKCVIMFINYYYSVFRTRFCQRSSARKPTIVDIISVSISFPPSPLLLHLCLLNFIMCPIVCGGALAHILQIIWPRMVKHTWNENRAQVRERARASKLMAKQLNGGRYNSHRARNANQWTSKDGETAKRMKTNCFRTREWHTKRNWSSTCSTFFVRCSTLCAVLSLLHRWCTCTSVQHTLIFVFGAEQREKWKKYFRQRTTTARINNNDNNNHKRTKTHATKVCTEEKLRVYFGH